MIGHASQHLGEAQVVVSSAAVSRTNPEIREAIRRGIPVIARAEMLAELMRLKRGIAVAGSHGKTTTTSLIAAVLTQGGLDPTMVVGGRLKSLRTNARLGKGEFLVAEADESDGSFLHLNPTIAVVTNIDREHLDHYHDFASLKKTFAEFVQKIPFYGLAVLCQDHPVVAELAAKFNKRKITYGLNASGEPPDWTATSIRRNGWGHQFTVRYQGRPVSSLVLSLPGRHNVLNSLAAIAVAQELGVPFGKIRKALAHFRGIARRFEIICERPVMMVDDYGHHPVEIKATLQTARELWPHRKIWVVFQPHRYTRTRQLLADFGPAFRSADQVLVNEIYAAGEEPIRGISGERLAKQIPRARYLPDLDSSLECLLQSVKRGDVVMTVGAGNVWKVGRELAKQYGSFE